MSPATVTQMHRFLSLLALAALAAPAPALAATQSAHSGTVAATFSFHGSNQSFHNETLTISRAGVVVYRQPVISKDCFGACWPAVPRGDSVSVRSLNASPEPDVLLELYTGGAHCCVIAQVFSYDSASGTYVKTERNFGDPGYVLRDLGHDGTVDFVTEDYRFDYAFSSYAVSGRPIQIFTFQGSRFQDVTRSYPALIRRDAAGWWRTFRHHYEDGEGLLAAWAADEAMLGHNRLVARRLRRELRAGHLHSLLVPHLSGRRYIRSLDRFLRRLHYLR